MGNSPEIIRFETWAWSWSWSWKALWTRDQSNDRLGNKQFIYVRNCIVKV